MSAVAEFEFIKFCQEVSHDAATTSPFWSKNLDRFERVFTKYRTDNKSMIPIQNFIDTYREILERPILIDDEVTHGWLIINEDEPIPAMKSWAPIEPRKMYIPMGEGWVHSIPLSEIYSTCIDISSSEVKTISGEIRRHFSGVTIDTLPAKFLNLFYAMLLEVETDNDKFLHNMEICAEIMTPIESTSNPMSGLPDMIGNLMNSDMAKNLMSPVTSVLGSIDSDAQKNAIEGVVKFTQNGDISRLMSSFTPILQNPAIQNIMTSLTAGMTDMSNVPSVTEDVTLAIKEDDVVTTISDQD